VIASSPPQELFLQTRQTCTGPSFLLACLPVVWAAPSPAGAPLGPHWYAGGLAVDQNAGASRGGPIRLLLRCCFDGRLFFITTSHYCGGHFDLPCAQGFALQGDRVRLGDQPVQDGVGQGRLPNVIRIPHSMSE
jgi:hypothetical protein